MTHAGHCREFSKVYNTRYHGGGVVWRRIECTKCGQRFTTFEITQEAYKKLMENKEIVSEIESPIWAVISPRKVEITDVPYSVAKGVQRELGKQLDGLFITTSAAAERLSAKEEQPQ